MIRLFLAFGAAAALAACTQPPEEVVVMDTASLSTACATAIAAKTGNRSTDITARSIQARDEVTTVTLDVPGAVTPWLCDVSDAGIVIDVRAATDVDAS